MPDRPTPNATARKPWEQRVDAEIAAAERKKAIQQAERAVLAAVREMFTLPMMPAGAVLDAQQRFYDAAQRWLAVTAPPVGAETPVAPSAPLPPGGTEP